MTNERSRPDNRPAAPSVWARLRTFYRSSRARWMVPWTLAAMGIAVTIAWILQPAPVQPQLGFRGGPGGPGGGGAAFRGAGGPGGGGPRAGGGARRAPPTDQGTAVGAAVAATGDIDVQLNALGTVTALNVVTVRPQISGQLQELGFKEGQVVQKGDFIAQIDPRSYELQLQNAQASLTRDRVLLENAKRDLNRYEELLGQNAISQQQVDTSRSSVAQYTAATAADEVQIGTAKLNLTYAHITAPISGRIGLRNVDPGNYVTPGDANGIGVITQLSPINVVFTLPEDNLPQLQKRMRENVKMPVVAYDRANATKLATGEVASLDNLIDVSTGTVRLKASFANDDGALFPNQFVNVRLVIDTVHNATVLPPAAIQHGAPGAFVFLVKPDSTVSIQPVKTGVSTAQLVQVVAGVQPGDRVVIDGVDRLREGTRVYLPNPPLDPIAGPQAEDPSAAKEAKQAPVDPPAQRQFMRRRPDANGAAPAPNAPGADPAAGPDSQRQFRRRQPTTTP
jgi:multidrug efflux system membrane fusion protein